MIKSCVAYGMDGLPITVEVDVIAGLAAFDIVGLPDASVKEISSRSHTEESSAIIKERVKSARAIQAKRYSDQQILTNAQMSRVDIEKYCLLDQSGQSLLAESFSRLGMSGRGYDRVHKISRTIADLANEEQIKIEHIAEAIQYRTFDREKFHEF